VAAAAARAAATVARAALQEVAVARRVGGLARLVPQPYFVPIASHVALMRELLRDWRAGHHLLLLGVGQLAEEDAVGRLLHTQAADTVGDVGDGVLYVVVGSAVGTIQIAA